ncbi:MAG: aldehyde dehydrogenase family protein, partial [Cocleimonas sp.]
MTKAKPQTSTHWKNYIAGKWSDSNNSLSVSNPATGKEFATIACASIEDVEKAVDAARVCADSGILTKDRPATRVQMMLRIADNIREVAEEGAQLLVKENGKSLADAHAEFDNAARYFEYYGGMADKIEGKSIPLGDDYVDYTVYEPVGVSAQIVPWNFPVDICARSLAPALAAGNAVVVKSPEMTPLSMTLLATACEKAGLPKGALSILCGVGSEVGAALVANPKVDQIVFTGSVPTGQHILKSAADNATPCVMELGGKSAAVVFPDFDKKQFLDSVAWGIFFNAGQVCSAMSRVLVHEDIYEELVSDISEMAKSLSIDSGETIELTPVVSKDQQQQVLSMCDAAVSQGARLVTGGKAVKDKEGFYVEPTVFADIKSDMTIFQNEVFGPVVSITS